MIALDRNSAPVSISTEARGRARDLRRRVEREDEAYLNSIRRYPRRNVRPEMIAALIERWRFMDNRDFRTHIEARLERTRVSLSERRVVAGKMRQRVRCAGRGQSISRALAGMLRVLTARPGASLSAPSRLR